MAASVSSDDMLEFAQNGQCQKMLSKMNNNYGELEHVVLSLKLIEINKKGKEQNRVLLLTNKALYNLKPNQFKKYQRRIDLVNIISMTISKTSQEFAAINIFIFFISLQILNKIKCILIFRFMFVMNMIFDINLNIKIVLLLF